MIRIGARGVCNEALRRLEQLGGHGVRPAGTHIDPLRLTGKVFEGGRQRRRIGPKNTDRPALR
jgi:hypothetical protein